MNNIDAFELELMELDKEMMKMDKLEQERLLEDYDYLLWLEMMAMENS